MDWRILASGLALSLALAGCKTVTVKGNYNLAEHPGKGLVAISTRMDAGLSCPMEGSLGFRTATPARGGAVASVDSLLLVRPEPQEDSLIFPMQTPRPVTRVLNYSQSEYSDMGVAEERVIPAEPPARFVVQEVPAGDYVLNSVTLFIPGHPGVYKATRVPPYWFRIKAGEVVYLGEMGVDVEAGSCSFEQVGLYKGFDFSVTDEWRRDSRLFKAQIPNLGPEVVQRRLLQKL